MLKAVFSEVIREFLDTCPLKFHAHHLLQLYETPHGSDSPPLFHKSCSKMGRGEEALTEDEA